MLTQVGEQIGLDMTNTNDWGHSQGRNSGHMIVKV